MNKSIRQGAAVIMAAWASLASAADEIKLQDATSIISRSHGLSQQQVGFEAVVKNLSPNKQVFAHYKGADGRWVDAPLTFNRSGSGNLEVWSGSLPSEVSGPTFDVDFALRYVVNGQTYWDNNKGSNYHIGQDSGIQLGAGVNVDHRYSSPTRILGRNDPLVFGAVAVRNLAVVKDVTIRYTTDNWATSRAAKAFFNPDHWRSPGSGARSPNEYGVEMWSYQLDVGTATQVDYAVEYVVNGETFWDNNLGQNYRLILIRP